MIVVANVDIEVDAMIHEPLKVFIIKDTHIYLY